MTNDVHAIERDIRAHLKPLDIPITAIKVDEAISKLKAKDEYDLCAEHLQFAREEIVPFLTQIINLIFNRCHMPNILKGRVL